MGAEARSGLAFQPPRDGEWAQVSPEMQMIFQLRDCHASHLTWRNMDQERSISYFRLLGTNQWRFHATCEPASGSLAEKLPARLLLLCIPEKQVPSNEVDQERVGPAPAAQQEAII